MNQNTIRREWCYYEHVAAAEFPGEHQIVTLVRSFLINRRNYCPSFVKRLFRLATGRSNGETGPCEPSPSWELRRLAALSLQHQFLCLPTQRLEESLAFL
jgi:hypothetical protein